MSKATVASGPLDNHTFLLGEVAAALGSAGSVRDVMRALVDSLAPAFCDGCEVVMPDGDGTLRRVAVGPAWVSSREHVPVPALAEHPVRQVLASGQVMVLDVDDPQHAELFGPAEAPLSARALGVRSAVLAPLAGRAGVARRAGRRDGPERPEVR